MKALIFSLAALIRMVVWNLSAQSAPQPNNWTCEFNGHVVKVRLDPATLFLHVEDEEGVSEGTASLTSVRANDFDEYTLRQSYRQFHLFVNREDPAQTEFRYCWGCAPFFVYRALKTSRGGNPQRFV